MTHDPLCLLPSSCEQYPHGHPRAKGFYCDDCEIDCECDRITAVRADEREQAAESLHGHSQHGYRCECGADLNNYKNHLQNVIRGEE